MNLIAPFKELSSFLKYDKSLKYIHYSLIIISILEHCSFEINPKLISNYKSLKLIIIKNCEALKEFPRS